MTELWTLGFAVFAGLFSVVNPFGALPVFLALTPMETQRDRTKLALNISIYFVIILMSFFWGGSLILEFFGLKLNALRIAGGLVILNSGYSLLNGKFAESRAMTDKVRAEAMEKEDISFAPMAMPMLSGPGSISLLISYYAEYTDLVSRGVISLVIIVTGIVIYGMLRFSPILFDKLGIAGIKAITRIMGFIVMAIGVQYIITGITFLVNNLLSN